MENYKIKELHKPLFLNGKCMFESKSIKQTQEYVESELNTLWDSYRRITSPKTYKVDLSQNLWNLKTSLLNDRVLQK